ncbi:unnamed protein product [Haemonchus placei]|uniref:Uncharacterized protein n=1 Tax=Haemonchus placei TaxID=6290 RepID=A0A0N4WND2_HAEPC|nr:unnamed protein product [Haemonchus placei]
MVRASTKKFTEPSNTEGMGLELKVSNHEEPNQKRDGGMIKKDLAEARITAEDAVDRQKWRRFTRTPDHATAQD